LGGGAGSDAGGGSGGGGQDGGTASSDCDGLVPGTPGAPSEFRWMNRDLNPTSGGYCGRGETDGTGHVALSWQDPWQPHDSKFAFLDPATGSQVGSYDKGIRLELIGQARGFMGANCVGSICQSNYVVLDPVGKSVYESPGQGQSPGLQANDPTGGMIHARYDPPNSGYGESVTVLLDAIDPSGGIRWTQPLPDKFLMQFNPMLAGVDRQGNVLALWVSEQRYGKGTWAGQWFDHAGTPGPVFQAFSGGASPSELHERVGDGLLVSGYTPGGGQWTGKFDAGATSMSPPPAWFAARPGKSLHMIHGGKGYAVLPAPENSTSCEQQIEVISPSGQVCGSATFSIGGGACTTGTIIVGYDGTVVQQGPRERETCSANDHICTCAYRYWPGFFR